MTAFEPSASQGGTVDEVVTLGSTPPAQWRLVTSDPEPESPSYISPEIDATSPPIELRARLTVVSAQDHVLDLDLKIVTYADGDPPPSDPIIIADVPQPLPEPDE